MRRRQQVGVPGTARRRHADSLPQQVGTLHAVVLLGPEAVAGGGELPGAETGEARRRATAGQGFEDRHREGLEAAQGQADGAFAEHFRHLLLRGSADFDPRDRGELRVVLAQNRSQMNAASLGRLCGEKAICELLLRAGAEECQVDGDGHYRYGNGREPHLTEIGDVAALAQDARDASLAVVAPASQPPEPANHHELVLAEDQLPVGPREEFLQHGVMVLGKHQHVVALRRLGNVDHGSRGLEPAAEAPLPAWR